MSDLIKISSNLLSQMTFRIKNIDCEDSNYESFEVKNFDENENVIVSTNYTRSAWGRVEYVANFEDQTLMLSFDWQADASSDSYKDSFDFEVDFPPYELSEERNFIVVDEDFSIEEIEHYAADFEDFRAAAKQVLPFPEDEVIE